MGCFLSIAANALDFEVGGIKYTTVDGGVEVMGYNSSYEGDLHLDGAVTNNDVTYNVVSIREYSFNCCSSLTSVGDLTACTSIGNSAFSGCSSLTNIVIGASCTSIFGGAFHNVNSVLTILATTPPTLTSALFTKGIQEVDNFTILVPAEAVEAYRAADYWKDIKMQIISKDAQHEWNVTTPVLSTIGASQFENVISHLPAADHRRRDRRRKWQPADFDGYRGLYHCGGRQHLCTLKSE